MKNENYKPYMKDLGTIKISKIAPMTVETWRKQQDADKKPINDWHLTKGMWQHEEEA